MIEPVGHVNKPVIAVPENEPKKNLPIREETEWEVQCEKGLTEILDAKSWLRANEAHVFVKSTRFSNVELNHTTIQSAVVCGGGGDFYGIKVRQERACGRGLFLVEGDVFVH